MTEITKFHKPNGTQPISEELDDLAKTIVSLVSAMKTDFGPIFEKRFAVDDEGKSEELRQYKRRLYKLLRGKCLDDLESGYETFIGGAPKFPPAIPELMRFVDEAERVRVRAINNASESERVTALPKPVFVSCNPLDMLAKAKSDTAPRSAEEMANLVKAHEALISAHRAAGRVRKVLNVSAHLCGHGACNREGTISNGTAGGGNFYCAEHFRLV